MIDSEPKENSSLLSLEFTAGGGLTLDGADYYWFFTNLMIGTALLFIPFALIYKPKTYLHKKEDTQGPFTVWVLQSTRH